MVKEQAPAKPLVKKEPQQEPPPKRRKVDNQTTEVLKTPNGSQAEATAQGQNNKAGMPSLIMNTVLLHNMSLILQTPFIA